MYSMEWDIKRHTNRKIKVVQKIQRQDTTIEEDEEEQSDFDNYDTSDKEVHQPIKIHIEDELKIHTDTAIFTRMTQNE